jgi:hypothetical protein
LEPLKKRIQLYKLALGRHRHGQRKRLDVPTQALGQIRDFKTWLSE